VHAIIFSNLYLFHSSETSELCCQDSHTVSAYNFCYEIWFILHKIFLCDICRNVIPMLASLTALWWLWALLFHWPLWSHDASTSQDSRSHSTTKLPSVLMAITCISLPIKLLLSRAAGPVLPLLNFSQLYNDLVFCCKHLLCDFLVLAGWWE
jgi:hypothetical protein